MTHSASNVNTQSANASTAAKMRLLGYAGLLPFVLLAIAVHLLSPPLAASAFASLQHYAAVILTFVGAVHWGRAVALPENTGAEHRRLYWAVTPSLMAWVALSLPASASICLLVVAFLICWWMDRKYYATLPVAEWYMKMRMHLTIGVVGGLLIGWVGVMAL